MSTPQRSTEQVVLLDEDGNAIGVTAKAGVHHVDTPLHLAFSCHVFDQDSRVLVTQRALSKPTFPGVWTNSCCGHPAPGEDVFETVRRRVGQELGLRLDQVRLVLPAFRYRAVMADGVVENEMCPVFVATTSSQVRPDPEEVEAHEWVDWHEFRTSVLDGSRDVSLWCFLQVRELPADPLSAPEAPVAALPPGARPQP